MRGRYGKFLLSVVEAKYLLKGVFEPKINEDIKIKPFGKYVKEWDISIDKNCAFGFCQTRLHRIEYSISVTKKGKKLSISFNPFVIKALGHDFPVKHTFLPVIGCKSKKRVGKELVFDGFTVSGDFRDVIFTDDATIIDQTCATNWTHGGIYKGKFDIILQMKQ